jgi:hypothetical protein
MVMKGELSNHGRIFFHLSGGTEENDIFYGSQSWDLIERLPHRMSHV